MKKLSLLLVALFLLVLAGCSQPQGTAQVTATTKPVYDFTSRLCNGTGISVGLLINENISCLHDYSLSVAQVRNVQAADVVVCSGAGLEDFMSDLLSSCNNILDSSAGITLLECAHTHEHDHDHHHEEDAHIWLAPKNAKIMAQNICDGLIALYPDHTVTFQQNLTALLQDLDALQAYGATALASLSCRELVTFHEGFGYFAQAFGLTVAAAVEEESGSETSAKELIHLINLMQNHNIPAVFTEVNGSDSAAKIISAEIGIASYALDMAMAGDYFTVMRYNIDTVKEALG